MTEVESMKKFEWERVVRDIHRRELVVLRNVNRLPVDKGDFISHDMVVVINLAGHAEVLYDMQRFTFHQWNVAVVCPNHMIAPMELSPDYNAVLMVISAELYEEMRHRTLAHNHIMYHSRPQFALTEEQVRKAMKIVDVIEMISQTDLQQMPNRHELLAYMFDVFFEVIAMYQPEEYKANSSLDKNEMLFSSFCELLAKNYRDHKTMTWYAEQLHLTPKYFSAQIQRIIGKTAADWIQEWLLTRAKNLLDTRGDMNIQEISQSLGFDEQASFTRFFRRGTGLSPRQWRERDKSVPVGRV